MKLLCIVILMLQLSFVTKAQTDSLIVEDYFGSDTLIYSVNEADCSKYSKRSIQKMNRMTERMRKLNNKYLHLFMKQEDAFLHSLCTIPVAEIPRLEMPSATLPTITSSTQTSTLQDPIHETEISSPTYHVEMEKPSIHPKTPKEVHFNKQSEGRAEAMMMDAWYSFNRFENRSEREANRMPQKYNPEMDSINNATFYMHNQCPECKKTYGSQLKQAQQELRQEMKRAELIQEYIQEQYRFMSRVMEEYPGADLMLLPMKKTGYYFQQIAKENASLLADRSGLEKKVMAGLNTLPGFNLFMDAHGLLSSIKPNRQAITAGSIPSAPKLQLSDLLKDAPIETQNALTALQTEGLLSKPKEALEEAKELKGEITDEVKNIGKGNEKDKEIWKPNPLKTKRVVDRFNYTSNFQVDRKNNYLPSGATLAFGISFQYHKNGNIGVGGSYIQPLPKIKPRSEDNWKLPTSPGAGLRSFVDFKIKGGLFMQGGYERNFREYNVHYSFMDARNKYMDSAMLGLKIKYPGKNKRSSPTMELLYDFLHRQTGQPAFVIRTGINIKGPHSLK